METKKVVAARVDELAKVAAFLASLPTWPASSDSVAEYVRSRSAELNAQFGLAPQADENTEKMVSLFEDALKVIESADDARAAAASVRTSVLSLVSAVVGRAPLNAIPAGGVH